MKYFLILLIIIGFAGIAYAEEIPVEIQTLNSTDLIITGTVGDFPPPDTPIVTIIIEDKLGKPILLESVSPDGVGHFSLEVKRQGPLWDGVTEFFVRAIIPDSNTPSNTVETEYGKQNIGKIRWEEAAYTGFENTAGTIQVIDPDVNSFHNAIDFLRINVWSDSSQHGTTITLTETDMNTGIFEGDVIFSNKYHFSRGVVFVSHGDTVTATYEDMTLPDDIGSDVYKVNATALIVGKRGPPLERAPASNFMVLDVEKIPIKNNLISIDQQIRLVSDLENQMDRIQPFAYLVQIQNSQNQVESLSWLTGNLTSFQKINLGTTWIPLKEGKYYATVFVWESVNNPTALSPPVSMELFVK